MSGTVLVPFASTSNTAIAEMESGRMVIVVEEPDWFWLALERLEKNGVILKNEPKPLEHSPFVTTIRGKYVRTSITKEKCIMALVLKLVS